MSSVWVNYLWTKKNKLPSLPLIILSFPLILCVQQPKFCVYSALLVPGCLVGRAEIQKKIISNIILSLYSTLQIFLALAYYQNPSRWFYHQHRPANMAFSLQCPFNLFLPRPKYITKSKLAHKGPKCINIFKSYRILVSIILRLMGPKTCDTGN